MRGWTFSPPKPSQGNNLHLSPFLLKMSFDPCISLHLWHTRLRERERGAAGTLSSLQCHTPYREMGRGSWAEGSQNCWGLELSHWAGVTPQPPHFTHSLLLSALPSTHESDRLDHPNPPLVLLEGKQPLAFQPFWQIKPLTCYLSKNSHRVNLHQCKGSRWEPLTQTLVHFLSLASLWFVGPTQTATSKYSVQPKEKREHSAIQPLASSVI